MLRVPYRVFALAGACAALALLSLRAAAQDDDESPEARAHGATVQGVDIDALKFRYIGPQGNRVAAVVGEPGNLNVYYAGAASGGIWKSVDAGIHWRPVFDSMPAQSIGAIAIASSDHQIIWAGTGESFIRSNVSIGDGVYKSTDGGATWTHMGLERSGRISRIVIDPQNPNTVFVAAEGQGYGAQPERGVYRSTDGGKTWDKVLFVNDSTGASDLAMDPENPRILVAGMWSFVIHTWGKFSGGSGSGVYISHDGGTTWKRATKGLPTGPLGKVAVAIAPNDASRWYALIETGWEGKGALWRSDDGGAAWHVVSYSHLLAERPHYYTRIMVSPATPNEVYFPSNFLMRSLDGGETAEVMPWGGDTHDMWADPSNADRMMIGDDGGVQITTTHGRQWHRVVLPIAQMYHVAVDNEIPYNVYGNEQDYTAVRGPSNSQGFSIPSALWQTTAGCESGFSYPDPVDTTIVWGGCYEGGLEKFDLRSKQSFSVDPWPDRELDSPADSAKYRWNWTQPLALSPFDHNTVYVGSQYVHRTTDGGKTWAVISPDLTTDDSSKMHSSGGLTDDNLGVEYCCTLFAIAESPLVRGLIWTGSNDGKVHVTRDAGAHWTDVTPTSAEFPKDGTIDNVEPSRYDAGRAYISVDAHQANNRDPFIYETNDYGHTWRLISAGIPRSVFSYVGIVREDPKRKGMLYAGTENGLYVTLDDGAHWFPLQSNLPHAPVTWIVVQEHFDDLVISTKGRGFWILDDVSPLRGIDATLASKSALLFAPRPAYRFRGSNRIKGDPDDISAGRNPPYGAVIDFYLKDSTKDSVHVTIRDAQNGVVRKLTMAGAAGLNRTWWDLRYDHTRTVALRTTPKGYPQIWTDKRFIGKLTRRIYHYGIEDPVLGPLIAPGTYTVELDIGTEKLSQPLTVLKDPHSGGTPVDAQAQSALAYSVYQEIDSTVDAINAIEKVRKQLEDLRELYGHDSSFKSVFADARTLQDKLDGVENELLQPVLQENDQKTYRAPMRLYLRLLFLAGSVGSGAGDVAGDPDFAPTAADVAVHDELAARLRTVLERMHGVMTQDVPAFNNAVAGKTALLSK